MTTILLIEKLTKSLEKLEMALAEKGEDFKDVIKLGSWS